MPSLLMRLPAAAEARVRHRQGVPTEVFNSAQGQNKTTVGIMVENGIINNMLTGAPAYMSKKFKKGDRQALIPTLV